MIRIFFCLFFTITSFNVFSQNLVPNPSFEEYIDCPYSTAEFETQVISWYSFNGTPDYYNVCSNQIDGFVGVPQNAAGWQYAQEGNAYAGILTYTHSTVNEREFIACSLIEPLVPGQQYYVNFYVNSYNGGELSLFLGATNRIGLKFFLDPEYNGDSNPYVPQNEADIEYNQMLTDSISWTNVSGSFIPDQAYNWLAIGNFYDDVNTDTLQLGEPGYCYGIYYIDNVCVSTSPDGCGITSVNGKVDLSNVQLFPNPFGNEFTVNSEKSTIENIEVVDLKGSTILRRQTHNNIVKVNTENWVKGSYIIRITLKNGLVINKLILKQ